MRTTGLALLLALSGVAHAGRIDGAGIAKPFTMGVVDGTSSPASKYQWDNPMLVFEPDGTPRNQLILFIHGHGTNSPPDGGELLTFAAAQGFHAISIDYDYGSDAPDPTKNNGPRYVCGCYTECYGEFHEMILDGTNSPGLPASRYPLGTRLSHILSFLSQHRSTHGWGQFLQGTNVVWQNVVLAGHSRGSSLATYLAKHHHVARVLLFSGDHDQLINGSPDNTNGDGDGLETTYQYGASHGSIACVYPTFGDNLSPHYLQDNPWTGTAPNNTPWQTQRNQCGPNQSGGCIYAFSNEADTVAPYQETFELFNYGTAQVLNNLGFYTLGKAEVGNYWTGETTNWQSGSPHWLTPGNITFPGTTVSILGDACGKGDPHDSTISDDCIQSGTAIMHDVWTYMLNQKN